MEAFHEGQLVIYVQDCVSAVDHVKGTLWERSLSGISHLKLDLRLSTCHYKPFIKPLCVVFESVAYGNI